jgi:prephenate dehydrogenase
VTTVTIVGVGLIGGSFALALRKAGFDGRILGVSSPTTISRAAELGVIDAGLPLAEAVPQSDVVYLAQPISRILETLAVLKELAPSKALITDVGSTKAAIMSSAEGLRFVGGHPMAGKESRGVDSAEANLFRGRPYVLTSHEPWLVEWIQKIGARLVILDPVEHDRLVALTSHLPQLISTALACSIAGEPAAARVAGPAALDLTRLALSPYEIWRDIFATNAAQIDVALDAFIGRLEQLKRMLRNPAIESEFDHAAMAARSLRERS